MAAADSTAQRRQIGLEVEVAAPAQQAKTEPATSQETAEQEHRVQFREVRLSTQEAAAVPAPAERAALVETAAVVEVAIALKAQNPEPLIEVVVAEVQLTTPEQDQAVQALSFSNTPTRTPLPLALA